MKIQIEQGAGSNSDTGHQPEAQMVSSRFVQVQGCRAEEVFVFIGERIW